MSFFLFYWIHKENIPSKKVSTLRLFFWIKKMQIVLFYIITRYGFCCGRVKFQSFWSRMFVRGLIILLFNLSSKTTTAKQGVCVGNITASEYHGLLSLFASTNGINWRWNPALPNITHWHFPNSSNISIRKTSLLSPCGDAWQGLNCSFSSLSSSTCTIQNITLAGMNLVRNIPSDISRFSNMEVVLLVCH